MTSTLFAYGTLQHNLIISYVLGRVPESAPAMLQDFARYAIRGEDFPGLIPEADAETDGTAFFDISPSEWEKLDSYESDLYDRQSVTIVLEDGKTETAYVYVIPHAYQHVLSKQLWEIKKYNPNLQP
ncbi:gamma-glutamylcyclotransferase [Kiritimatiellaeota bacterium B1221]|nr:gamma-glutamylcyclotransferase [Kiritimatiellaeota bacterium B1221]